MVAKISNGASLYGALSYNHGKLMAGTARVLSGNMMPANPGGDPAEAMRRALFAFEGYVDHPNSRCSKPVVHISLNPDPRDKLTDGQCAMLAKDYLERMGFADQPYIVYKHEDIDRHHLHIVTTRVTIHGKRIDNTDDYRRSMAACRELEEKYGLRKIEDKEQELLRPYLKKVEYKKGDVKRQVANTLRSALEGYKFQSFGEWSALLSLYNIEAKPVRGEFRGKPYAGVVYTPTNERGLPAGNPYKSSLFGKAFGHEGLTRRMQRTADEFRRGEFAPQIRDAVAGAMRECGGRRARFEKLLARQGIGVVLRQNDQGRIYGVTFIDHNRREVCNGSRLGKEFSANAFQAMFSGQAAPPRQAAPEAPESRGYGHAPGDEGSAHDLLLGGPEFTQHGPDYQDEAYARRLRRKKRKKPAL